MSLSKYIFMPLCTSRVNIDSGDRQGLLLSDKHTVQRQSLGKKEKKRYKIILFPPPT